VSSADGEPTVKKFVDGVLTAGALVSFVTMIAVVLLQILARYALPFSFHWTEEAARFSFLYTVAFASGLAMRNKAFVNVDLLPISLHGRARLALELGIDSVTLLFLGVLFQHARRFVQIGARQTSSSLRIPMNNMFFITILIAVAMGFYVVVRIVETVKTGQVTREMSDRVIGDSIVVDEDAVLEIEQMTHHTHKDELK
jgi:TRAP-type transport system small permease protein